MYSKFIATKLDLSSRLTIVSREAKKKQPYATNVKTHDSESRGQEEAAVRDERVSYLQVAPLKNSQTL